jgi:hypothetical protein
VKSHKEIGKIYVKQAKSNIKNYHEDTVVKKKGKEYPIVRGQLKKSLGIWRPNSRRTGVVVGPRANAPMRKKVRPQADWLVCSLRGGAAQEIRTAQIPTP